MVLGLADELSISLKANVLHAMGVSTFLLISIISILDSPKGKNHLKVVKGLLLLSILILVVTLYSFCDDYYNKVALTLDDIKGITIKEHLDALLHISMIVTLVFLEIAFVYTRLTIK